MQDRVNPGRLDRQITLERQTETVAPSGAVVRIWTPYATVRAELITQDTTDYLSGIGEGATGTVAFRLWWRDGITTADRITYAGQAYAVTNVVELGRRYGLELRAVSQ